MGLEVVELVMDAEDEFGIKIPDEALQEIRTVGEFHDFIVRQVRASGSDALRARADLEDHLWSRLRATAAAHSNHVRPEHITRTTRFVEDLGYG